MKTKQTRLKRAAIIVLAAITVAVVFFGHGGSHQSNTATTTVKPSVPTTTTPRTVVQKAGMPHTGQLEKRVNAFLMAYYRILPGDTAAVRRRRISRYVSRPLAARLKLSGNKPQGPTVQGQVLTDEMVVSRSRLKSLIVQVPVRVYVRRLGSTEKYITIDTVSVWTNRPDGWVASSFN